MTSGARDDDRSIDERFADIVAHWDPPPPGPDDAPSAHDQTPASGADGADVARPAREAAGEATPGEADRSPNDDSDSDSDSQDAPRPVSGRRPLPPPPSSGWRVHVPPEDEDEGYVPPPPAPLPRHDWMFWGALAGLVIGPVWLVYLVAVERAVNRTPMWFAGGLIVAGFALLVARLPARRAPDDDDDGARV